MIQETSDLKQAIIQLVLDQIGENPSCYMIDCQSLEAIELDLELDKLEKVKFLHKQDLTGKDKTWQHHPVKNYFLLCKYQEKNLFVIFKSGIYDFSCYALSAPNEMEILHTFKSKYKKIKKIIKEPDPFEKEQSLIYLEKHLIHELLSLTQNEKKGFKKHKI